MSTDPALPPSVSILMPCYNVGPYVGRAIRSILRQTFRDFELIVVDDGSDDDTTEVIARCAAEDVRLRFLRREHEGLTPALIAGMALARAPLIARLDGDDFSAPRRLERQVAYLNMHPEVVLLGTRAIRVDSDGEVISRTPSVQLDHEGFLAHPVRAFVHSSVMFRRWAYDAAGGYRPGDVPEDRLLWQRMAQIGRVANLSEELTGQTVRSESIVAQPIQLRRSRRSGLSALEAMWAHRAYNHGFVRGARKHAWRAWRLSPWSPSLLALATFLSVRAAFPFRDTSGNVLQELLEAAAMVTG